MSQLKLQKHISRLMALLLCLMLILPCVPTAHAEEGTCGSNLTWSFDGSTLTISGSGAMTDYTEGNMPPWYSFREDIQRLSLPEGLTRIGNIAFYDCNQLTAVSLPGTVTEIGDIAFAKNRSLTMLSLNNGLRTIGRSAFVACENLVDLRIPNTVTTIGDDAFYMCFDLTCVTIPSSVTSMGSGVFAYCDSLVSAQVDANIGQLPTWTFHGCDSLSSATFKGNAQNTEYLKTETGETNVAPAPDTNPDNGNSSPESVKLVPSGDSGIKEEKTTATQTDNSTIIKTDNTVLDAATGETSTSTDITASVTDPEGWNEVVDQIQSVQGTDEPSEEEETETPELGVTVYVPNDSKVPEAVLKDLAGSNVTLTVNTQSGSRFTIDCAELDKKSVKKDLNLSYTITLLDTVPEGIQSSVAYQLVFHDSCEVNVEVMIRLPLENTQKAASLYQMIDAEPYEFLQSVVVDNEAYAHYYLGSIDQDAQYLIAMDVQGEQTSQAIIPEVLHDEYKLVDHATGKEYVITGRKSSWNMGLGKVMAILAVVMVSVVVVVGFVMYFWNKQRLKNGYVPQWDDEE